MTFEELQINLNLVFDDKDKKKILIDVASRCKEGYFFVDDEGECYLLDKDGNLDDIKKIKFLREKHIKKDIKKIKIPDNVTIIGDWAFQNCSNLMSIMIPNGVVSIGVCAFYGCKGLKELIFKGKTLKQIKSMNYYSFGIRDESIIRVE